MERASELKAPRRRRARGGGEGDVHQRPDGRWEARLDFGFQLDDEGRKHRVGSRSGLEYQSPHSLRHDFAGQLLSSGVASRVTQELMRHTRYELTANVYQQPPAELLRLATAQIDQALGYQEPES